MSCSRSSRRALATGPGLPSPTGFRSHSTTGATLTELPNSIISRAARASATGMSQTRTSRMSFRARRGGGQLEKAEGRAPGEDVVERRVLEDPVLGDEGHVHVGEVEAMS